MIQLQCPHLNLTSPADRGGYSSCKGGFFRRYYGARQILKLWFKITFQQLLISNIAAFFWHDCRVFSENVRCIYFFGQLCDSIQKVSGKTQN